MYKKKTIITLLVLLMSLLTLVGCENSNTKNEKDLKVGDTVKNGTDKDENTPKKATDEELKSLDTVIKNTFTGSFRYDKTFGTYFSDRSESEMLPKGYKDSDVQEKVMGYRYYEIQKDASGDNKLIKYYITKDEKQLSDALEDTDLRTKGIFHVYKDKYELYNENVYFDKDTKEPVPILREYYGKEGLIKEGGANSTKEVGIVTNRLPDEPIMLLSIINTMPIKDIVGAAEKTGYFKEVVTSDGMAFYTMIRNSSSTMFANELLKNLIEDPKLMKKYSEELNKYGIDITKKDNPKLKQEYIGRTATIENMLRAFMKEAVQKGYFNDINKYQEVMKKDKFDTRIPLGDLLKNTYENIGVPYDNTISGLTVVVEKDENGKSKLSWVNLEKVYDNVVGDLTRYVIYYTQDDDTKMLETNKESMKKVKSFKKELNPNITAQLRLLQVPEYADKLTKNISNWTLYQDYYENLRILNSEGLLGKLTKEQLQMLNGLDKEKVQKENPTSKTVDWFSQVISLSAFDDKVETSNKHLFKTYEGKNSTNNDFKVSLRMVNPVSFIDKIEFLDIHGNKMDKSFKIGNEKDIPLSVFIAKESKEFQAKQQEKQEVEGKVVEDSTVEERKTSPFKDGKLVSYQEAYEKGAFQNAVSAGDGYLEVLKRMYNKDISDAEAISGGKVTKLINKNGKPTIMVYSDIDCPFCRKMYKVLANNYDKITKDYNLVIFNASDYNEDIQNYHSYLDTDTELTKEDRKNLKKLFDNNLHFNAKVIYDYMNPSYKPTVMLVDKDGVVSGVFSGVTEDYDFNQFLTSMGTTLNTTHKK